MTVIQKIRKIKTRNSKEGERENKIIKRQNNE
jgi:hypothetical protein